MALPIFPNFSINLKSNTKPILARISNGSVPATASPSPKQYKPFQGLSLSFICTWVFRIQCWVLFFVWLSDWKLVFSELKHWICEQGFQFCWRQILEWVLVSAEFKQKRDNLIFLGIRNVCSVSNHKFSFARWWWIMPREDGRFCITLKMQLSSYLKLWIHRLWGRWISFYLIPRNITISRRQKMDSIAWNSRIFLPSPQISQKGKKIRVFEALGNETEARLYTLQQLDSWCS